MSRLPLYFLLLTLFGLSLSQAKAQIDFSASYVDFGAPRSEYPFNSFLDFEVGAQQNLGAHWGCGSGIEIIVVDNFAGIDSSGTMAPDASLGFPASATSDGFFGHTQPINGVSNPSAAFEIRNLSYDPGPGVYDTVAISLFASSMGSGNRQTCYTLFGRDTITVCLDAANNTDEALEVRMRPAERGSNSFDNGYVRIEATAGPDNDTPEGYFYLNALSIVDENIAYIY